MKRLLGAVCATVLAVQLAAAVEVRLLDGTVLDAEQVRVTGSYVMLVLANGAMVAYDVADVDLSSLPFVESGLAAAGDSADDEHELGSGRTLKDANRVGEETGTGLRITDREVRHVQGSGVLGEEELIENPPGSEMSDEIPDGYSQGGSVLVNNLKVAAVDDGLWQVTGEIVNRHTDRVFDVSVRLEQPPTAGVETWRTEIKLSEFLDVNEKAVFQHEFEAPKPADTAHPDVRATAIWMQRGGSEGPEDVTETAAPSRPSSSRPASRANVLPTPTPTPME
ncbi:MAG: hypothetical protein PVG92_00350 [Holophagae bacterium]|jgi:hypothetical protein